MDVLQDRKSNGEVVNYVNSLGIDNKLKITTGTTSKYFLADHLGSTTGLADSNGVVTESASYDSFGRTISSNLTTRYQYTGREYDEYTGLMFYRARFYDPQIGRFISEDPIGFKGGVNWYAYVDNNSINFSDPLGLLKNHTDLDKMCNGDCDDIRRDINKLTNSIPIRSAELSRRRKQGLKIDDGHTGRLAAERSTLEKCIKRYKAMGCDDENPQTPVPVYVPQPQEKDKKNRKPCQTQRLRPIPLTQFELDLQAQSAQQYYIFWQKVTFGGYLVSGVLTGGAVFGTGAGAGAAGLFPVFAL